MAPSSCTGLSCVLPLCPFPCMCPVFWPWRFSSLGPCVCHLLVPRRQVWTGATDGTACRDRIGRMDGTAPTGAARLSAAARMGARLAEIFFFSPSVVPEAGLHPPLWAQNRIGGCVVAGKLVDSSAVLFLPVHAYVELPWIRGARCGISRANGLSTSVAEPGLTKRGGRAARESTGEGTGRGRDRPSWRRLSRATSLGWTGGSPNRVCALQFRRTRPSGRNRAAALVQPPPVMSRLHSRTLGIDTQHAHAMFEWTSEG